MADLRDLVFAHLQRLEIAFYDSNPAGRLVTRVTTDVEALGELFSNCIVGILANLLMVVFFLAAMSALSTRLTLTLAATLPVFAAMTIVFRGVLTPTQQRVRILIARLNALIAEHVNGIAVLQLFNRQEASAREFGSVNFQFMVACKGWTTANAWFTPMVELMGTVSQAALLWVGASLLTSGRLTIGVLIAFLQYGARFLRPIQDVSERYVILQTSIVSAERVFRLLDTPAPREETSEAAPAGTDIEFDGVWFAYRGEEWVLRDLSFRVEARQCLAVVGHTGAGKTTLTNLLLRFYDPQIGAIRLGGMGIRTMDVEALRRHFGVVLQDTYVHAGSILENIHFGQEAEDEENAREAARLTQVDQVLGALPNGLETQIVERGDNLSAGQKQLIGIARAICRDPKLLILDEATSDIDTGTETHILRALSGLLSGRTSIIIAHRLTTVLRADRIMLLHKGILREWRTHAELLALRGLYWRLYQLQYGPRQRQEPVGVL